MKIQQHWFKRLLALALVIVTLLQWVPAQAIAAAIEDYKSNASFTPGDVNDDGVIDEKDVYLYILGLNYEHIDMSDRSKKISIKKDKKSKKS